MVLVRKLNSKSIIIVSHIEKRRIKKPEVVYNYFRLKIESLMFIVDSINMDNNDLDLSIVSLLFFQTFFKRTFLENLLNKLR